MKNSGVRVLSMLLVAMGVIGFGLTSVGCGSEHCVVCIDDGSVFSWGSNDEGQLGVGDCDERDSPCVVELPDGELARAVCCSALDFFFCCCC